MSGQTGFGEGKRQTPSTGLRHPSFNHCRIQLRHRVPKLLFNEQFFVGVQTVVCLSQAIQIISDVCFITNHVAYASSKPKPFKSRRNSSLFLFFLPGVDAPHVYVRSWALGCFHSLISTQTPSTSLRHPSEGAGKRCWECACVLGR